MSEQPGPRPQPQPDARQPDALQPGAGSVVTGDQAVDEALAPLSSVAELPVREHVAVFDAVHRALSDRLAESRE